MADRRTGNLERVSVVVVGYKRLDLLTETVRSLLAVSTYQNLELILCDDGSPPTMQEQMRRLPFDRFLLADRNQGLGANTNQGLKAAGGDYILQLQDDWRCLGPPDFIQAALEVLKERPDVFLVRYRPMNKEPAFQTHVTESGRKARIYENGQFSRTGEFPYSDNPHLKRRAFHDRLGLYREGVPMTRMELDFCQRVDEQDQMKVAWLEGFDVFRHIGKEQSFNPSQRRARLRQRLESNFLTRWPLRLYLGLKKRSHRPG